MLRFPLLVASLLLVGLSVVQPSALIPRDCSSAIAQWRGWVDRDVEIGMLTPSVREVIRHELESIEARCAAGQNGAAMSQLTAAKRRHGYPQ